MISMYCSRHSSRFTTRVRRRSASAPFALPLLTIAAAAHAVPVETIVTAVGAPAVDGTVTVQLAFLNSQGSAAELTVPDRVAGSVLIAGTATAVSLHHADVATRSITVAPGGFARAAYTVQLPDARGSVAVLTLAGGAVGYAYGSATTTPVAGVSTMGVVAKPTASPAADRDNAFLGNLSAYEPIYAVYGPGTSTDALIQISFKYQLFGNGGAPADQRRWTDGITFAYTQRLYWDLGAKSAPFRNIDFQPELFYLIPPRPLTSDVLIGGQAGIRHKFERSRRGRVAQPEHGLHPPDLRAAGRALDLEDRCAGVGLCRRPVRQPRHRALPRQHRPFRRDRPR